MGGQKPVYRRFGQLFLQGRTFWPMYEIKWMSE